MVDGQEVPVEEALAALMYVPVRHGAFHIYENVELDTHTKSVRTAELSHELNKFTE